MVQVTLSTKSSVLLTSRCQSPELSVFVDRVADPVDSWIVTDGSMSGIHQDDFEVLVSRILDT